MQYTIYYVIITFVKRDRIQRRREEEGSEFILGNLDLTWKDLGGKSVLDIGAADARLGRAAKRRGMDVVSIDNHEKHLREHWRSHLPKNLLYIQADAKQLPFPDATFDLVISHASVPLILVQNREEIHTIISESHRVLKPNGEFRFGGGSSTTIASTILDGGEEPMMMRMSTGDENIEYEQKRTLTFLHELFPEIECYQPIHRRHDYQRYYVLRKSPENGEIHAAGNSE